MLYRKKPVEVEAEQWLGEGESWEKILALGLKKWLPGMMGSNSFLIETLEGNRRVQYKDFVVRGVAGEFYSCKPDIFAATYELAATPPKTE